MELQESLDKHCESIDFSNSCRQFYMTRLKATEDFKRKVEQSSAPRTSNSKKPATNIGHYCTYVFGCKKVDINYCIFVK
jgi:hypothetical protein